MYYISEVTNLVSMDFFYFQFYIFQQFFLNDLLLLFFLSFNMS